MRSARFRMNNFTQPIYARLNRIKNQEYFPAVNSQHNTEDDYCKGGEQYVEHRLSKETFYPVMILDTPYQVTGQFTVKEPHGSRISLERKSEMSDTLTRVLMWSSMQRRITSISVRLNTNMSWLPELTG